MDIGAILDEVVALVRSAQLGIVEGEAFAITQKKCLDVARWSHLKNRRCSGENKRGAGLCLDLDVRRACGRLLGVRLGLRARAAQREERNQCKDADREHANEWQTHWTPLAGEPIKSW